MAHQVTCREAGYDCDFMIRSESEDQLIEMVQKHAKETHDMDMSADDVRGISKSV